MSIVSRSSATASPAPVIANLESSNVGPFVKQEGKDQYEPSGFEDGRHGEVLSENL